MTLMCEAEGLRIDQFLSQMVPGLSRSGAQNLLATGCVTCNGKPVKKNYRTRVGDVIQVDCPEPEPLQISPTPMDLEIAYEDEDILVINKPKGLVVHPAAGHWSDTLVNGLLYARGASLSGINGVLRPGIVHRIDKDTSGLIVVAKNDLAHTVLASQLKDHTLARTYEAIVCGNLKEDRGTVNAPIGRHPSDRKRMAVTDQGRSAVTHWEVVAGTGDTRMSAAVWRQAGPIKFACTWRISDIQSWGTVCTAGRNRSWGRSLNACMPPRSAFATPEPGCR